MRNKNKILICSHLGIPTLSNFKSYCDYNYKQPKRLIFHPTNSKKGIAVVGNLRVELI